MNITVIGAAGRLGWRVVEEASRRGHKVAGLARRPERLARPELLWNIAAGDGRDRDTAARAVGEADAVVMTVADGTGQDPHQAADVTRAVTTAMREQGVGRLVITSAYPIVATRPATPPRPSALPPPAAWTGPSCGSTASPTTVLSARRTSRRACWTGLPACPGPTRPACWSISPKPATTPVKLSTSAAMTNPGRD